MDEPKHAREKPTGVIITDRILTEREFAEVSQAVREYDGALPLAEYLEKRLSIGIEYRTFREPEKHDGTLENAPYRGHAVAWHYNDIEIRDQGAENVLLSAKQALSLLAWLEQERETLEKIAKEQGGLNDE